MLNMHRNQFLYEEANHERTYSFIKKLTKLRGILLCTKSRRSWKSKIGLTWLIEMGNLMSDLQPDLQKMIPAFVYYLQ